MTESLRQPRLASWAAIIAPLVVSCAAHRATSAALASEHADGEAEEATAGPGEKEPEAVARTALGRKLARAQKFALTITPDSGESPESWAQQDWLEHSVNGTDNGPPDFTAFATARNDWFGLLGRPAFGTGAWVPLGPYNGQN